MEARSVNIKSKLRAKTSSISYISRAMTDCFSDELVALNQDLKDDFIILSGLKNLISDESKIAEEDESREDTDIYLRHCCYHNNNTIDDDDDDNDNNNNESRSNIDEWQSTSILPLSTISSLPTVANNNDIDDERSDFLLSKLSVNHHQHYRLPTIDEIPRSISFRPQKRSLQRELHQQQCSSRPERDEERKSGTTTNISSRNNINTVSVLPSIRKNKDYRSKQRELMMMKNNQQQNNNQVVVTTIYDNNGMDDTKTNINNNNNNNEVKAKVSKTWNKISFRKRRRKKSTSF